MTKEKKPSGVGNIVRQLRMSQNMTLPELADNIEGYDGGNLSRFERGLQGISEDKLKSIADYFGLTISRLYNMAEIDSVSNQNDSRSDTVNSRNIGNKGILLSANEVEVPFIDIQEISPQCDSLYLDDAEGCKIKLSKPTLNNLGIEPSHIACIKIHGNSMEPALPEDSIIGIDTSSKMIQDGKMYAINHNGMIRVKLLYRLPGNGVRLRSYNFSEYPDENYDNQQSECIRVIGRVFWSSAYF
ncbi:XRE family transcriptional regulator [Vibrio penaeicida]|uniref:XRE family transcriptional regulator n=1 Tax=Vibrio penaeicida TaxID=104609 RepID=UPI00142D6F6B|nr:XRE family transcriptional regulator [Vibrio penaeicida]